MRVPPPTTLVALFSLFASLVLPEKNVAARIAKSVNDAFPRLTISRRETFRDVQQLQLFLPGDAASPVVVTTPTVVFAHSSSGGNRISLPLDELLIDSSTRALFLATPLPAGGYNLPALSTTRPVVFLDVVVIAADPAGLTFSHRDGLARVPFQELSREFQLRYSFRNEPDQSVKLRKLVTSRPETEVFLDVRVIGADDPVNPTSVIFTHRESQTEPVTRPLAALQLTAADRATLLGNLNPQPPPMPAVPDPVTFFQTLTVSRSEFQDVEIVRADPGGLIFRHRDGGAETYRRGFDELILPDEVVARFGYKRALDIPFTPPDLATTRREAFRDVTIMGIDAAAIPAADRAVTFTHLESGGDSIVRRFGEFDAATQAAITDYLAAFPVPMMATTVPGSGIPAATPVFVDVFLPTAATVRNEKFENIEIVRSDVNGVSFRHSLSGGVAIFRRFEVLPDEIRARFGFKSETEGGSRVPTLRMPALTTVLGSVYRDVEILATESNGLVFRHRGGTTKLPFAELPDELRAKYDFKEDREIRYSSSTLRTNSGEVFLDVVILNSDPVGLTFRHRDGTTKVSFSDLPGDLRKKFNFNLDDALDFRRAHSVAAQPAPSRPRFFLIPNGHVPAIGAGVAPPALGAGRGAPAIGARSIGFIPSIGSAGRVPAIGGAFRTPPVSTVGRVPAVGIGGLPPAVGAGN